MPEDDARARVDALFDNAKKAPDIPQGTDDVKSQIAKLFEGNPSGSQEEALQAKKNALSEAYRRWMGCTSFSCDNCTSCKRNLSSLKDHLSPTRVMIVEAMEGMYRLMFNYLVRSGAKISDCRSIAEKYNLAFILGVLDILDITAGIDITTHHKLDQDILDIIKKEAVGKDKNMYMISVVTAELHARMLEYANNMSPKSLVQLDAYLQAVLFSARIYLDKLIVIAKRE